MSAQEFPSRPLRLVVGFPPGGGADGAARAVAQKLTESLGQAGVVDNRSGAGGNVAAEIVAHAVADGHTLLVTSPGPVVINPALYSSLPYDPQKELAPVTLIAAGANVLTVHPAVQANNVQQLMALARSKPDTLNYASSGIGTIPHLSGELFRIAARLPVVHVAYKGAGAAVIDVMAGRADYILVSVPSVLTQIRAKRLRALAVTTLKRAAALPDLPTIDESGLPGYESIAWWGVMAPAAVPMSVVSTLNRTIVKSLNATETRERLATEGVEVAGTTPAQFGDFLKRETAKWAQVIKTAGIRID
ncbi:MAG: tripartite tricarboxylate transporter substrate binding protein [Betaproteobacteria bacterium]